MSPAGGPVWGRYGDASWTCSHFWPCCSGGARPRRSQVRAAGTPGRPHPSAVCGSAAVPAPSPSAHLGFGPGRQPRLCPRALVARGRQAEERGGAAAPSSECPARAIHSSASGVRAAPAPAGSRERTGVVRALRAVSPSAPNFVTKLGPLRREVGALGGPSCRPGPGLWPRGPLFHSRIHRPGACVAVPDFVPSQLPSGLRGLRLWAPGVTAPRGWQVSGEDSAVWSETTSFPTC